MDDTQKPMLGDIVTIKAYVIPTKIPGSEYTRYKLERKYKRVEVIPLTGIICGSRILKEGICECNYDEGWSFKHKKSVPAYLVAVNMRQIFKVLPEDIVNKGGQPA